MATATAILKTRPVSIVIPDGSVTNAKQADMAAGTFKLRPAGSGDGPPVNGSSVQAKEILGLSSTDLKSDYGATMDGTTSDADAMQAALDAGLHFTIPEGVVVINAEVLVTNKHISFSGAGKNRTFIKLTGSSASKIKAMFTDNRVDFRRLVSIKGVTFLTGSDVHTPLDLYWNPQRIVRGRTVDLEDVGWAVVDDSEGSGQRFVKLAKLTNALGVSIRNFEVNGAREDDTGNGFLFDGGCIAITIQDYHCFYGDVLVEFGYHNVSMVYYKAITPGSAFELFERLTGGTSGARGTWIGYRGASEYTDASDSSAVWGCVYVGLDHDSANFVKGEVISDETGNSATITAVGVSCFSGEGLQIGDGEVVGYNKRLAYLPPRHAAQWGITMRLRGHTNVREIDCDVRMCRGLRYDCEILNYLGNTDSRAVNLDSVDGVSICVMADIGVNTPEVVTLADVNGWTVQGSVVQAGYTSLVKFLNANVFGGLARGNVSLGTALFEGEEIIPIYLPGENFTYQMQELTAVAVLTAGTGYAVGDLLVPDNTGKCGYNYGNNALLVQVTSINGSGGITGARIIAPGIYNENPANGCAMLVTPGSGGSGGTFTWTFSNRSSPSLPGNVLEGAIGYTGTGDMYGEASGLAISIGANSSGGVYTQFSVPGLRSGDLCHVQADPDISPVIVRARYDADDTVRVEYINPTTSSSTPSAHTLRVWAKKAKAG